MPTLENAFKKMSTTVLEDNKEAEVVPEREDLLTSAMASLLIVLLKQIRGDEVVDNPLLNKFKDRTWGVTPAP